MKFNIRLQDEVELLPGVVKVTVFTTHNFVFLLERTTPT
jgi:hypothetical protein